MLHSPNRYVLTALCLAAIATTTWAQAPPSGNKPRGDSALQLARMKLQVAQERVQEAKERQAELKDQRDAAVAKLDDQNVSDAAFADVMASLQTQRIQLMIDLKGLEARRAAVMDFEQKAASKQDVGALIGLLEQSVENAAAKLDRVKQLRDQGSISSFDVLEAEQGLLDARIQLVQARRDSAPAQSPETVRISIEAAEKAARLEMVRQLLTDFVASRKTVELVEQIENRMALNQMEIVDRESELRILEQQALTLEEQIKGGEDR